MQIKTTSRGLGEAINGVAGGANLGDIGDEHRPALASAFNALTRLIETSGSDVTLLADLTDDSVTLSIVSGVASKAITADTPWVSPHLGEIDKTRQAKAKAKEAEEARKLKAQRTTHRSLAADGRIQ